MREDGRRWVVCLGVREDDEKRKYDAVEVSAWWWVWEGCVGVGDAERIDPPLIIN